MSFYFSRQHFFWDSLEGKNGAWKMGFKKTNQLRANNRIVKRGTRNKFSAINELRNIQMIF
jgi:hypothetical protein